MWVITVSSTAREVFSQVEENIGKKQGKIRKRRSNKVERERGRQKNSIAGNRTRGTNVKGLYVTNYTTMDVTTKEKNKHILKTVL